MSKKFFQQLGTVRILLLASFVVGLLFFGSFVFKVSAETKNAGPLSISYSGSGPLFSASNIAPGYSDSKILTITNQGTIPHSFAIAVSGTLGDLAQVLHIAPKVSGVAVWDKTISDLAGGDSHTIIGSIAPGGIATIDLMAYLPGSVGNDYQGSTTMTFDFIVGDQEPEPTVSILPSPSGTGGGVGGASIAGTASVLGVSTSPSPSVSPSQSVSPSPSGEVQGEEKESSENGLDWKWLLVVPVVGILTILVLPATLSIAIALPLISGIIAAFFGARSHGTLSPAIFWTILIIEIVLFFAIEFYRWWVRRRDEDEEDFEEEI